MCAATTTGRRKEESTEGLAEELLALVGREADAVLGELAPEEALLGHLGVVVRVASLGHAPLLSPIDVKVFALPLVLSRSRRHLLRWRMRRSMMVVIVIVSPIQHRR